MELDNKDLKRLQGALLDILVEFDRVCRSNSIEYSLCGGTLIGAVREHGFIPWDDDADVALLRKEYDKFVEACKTDLNTERFFFQDYRTDPNYPWGYAKLRMNGTKIIQPGQENLDFHKGIYVDVFIYDNVPDGFLARRLHLFACYLIRKCQYSVEGRILANNNLLRGWYSILNCIPKKWLFMAIDKIAYSNNKKRTKLCRHLTYPYFKKEARYGLPLKCFDEYVDVDYEGKTFRIIKDYDTLLTIKYGDYMTPPPQSEIKHLAISSIEFPIEKEQR
jgi:lipopolysaccharide cholinephosphotransferase